MFARYRSTATYADETSIRLKYRAAEESVEEVTTFQTRFERPNRLRLEITREGSGVSIVSDGDRLTARLLDQVSQDFRNQIAQQAAPKEIALEHLYSITEFADVANPEVMTSVLFGLPVQLDFTQIALLLSKKEFDEVFREDAKTTLLDEAAIGSEKCFRVRVADAKDQFPLVFWVNQRDRKLVRLEFPTDNLRGQLQTDDISLTADFNHIRLDAPIADNEFQHPKLDSAKTVRYFVKPPTPLPSRLLGQDIKPFSFLTLGNQEESSTFLTKKHVVLIWFDKQAPSKFVLDELEKVKRRFESERQRIAFRVICAEPVPDFDNQEVRQLLSSNQISIPVVRDVRGVGRDRFGVEQAPTIVVLGKNQQIHLFEVGRKSADRRDGDCRFAELAVGGRRWWPGGPRFPS